jgi:rubrerythrin
MILGLALAALAAAGGGEATRHNLETAYNSEINARLRYEAFAAKADEEGYTGAAAAFKALAYSESVHAANHAAALALMGGSVAESDTRYVVQNTRENLAAALKMEKKESSKVYPGYLIHAVADGNEQANTSFKGALASERTHVKLLEMLMEKAADWKQKFLILVCRTCGYTSEDPGLGRCPFCSHPRSEFSEF